MANEVEPMPLCLLDTALDVRVLLEFVGGPVDGLTVNSDSDDVDETETVRAIYRMCDDGRVGRCVHCESFAVIAPLESFEHVYRVSVRWDFDSTVVLRLVHRQVT
jgi:hypothetical protein